MRMKLANALSQRADLMKRIEQLGYRLNMNAKVQEGEKPAEDPKALLKELEKDTAALEDLIARINLTNSLTKTKDGKSLTEYIAMRDVLLKKISIYRNFIDEASYLVSRDTHSEIKIESTVNVKTLRTELDRMEKEAREINETIQEMNWTADLL